MLLAVGFNLRNRELYEITLKRLNNTHGKAIKNVEILKMN